MDDHEVGAPLDGLADARLGRVDCSHDTLDLVPVPLDLQAVQGARVVGMARNSEVFVQVLEQRF
jgi:hypothetical protein